MQVMSSTHQIFSLHTCLELKRFYFIFSNQGGGSKSSQRCLPVAMLHLLWLQVGQGHEGNTNDIVSISSSAAWWPWGGQHGPDGVEDPLEVMSRWPLCQVFLPRMRCQEISWYQGYQCKRGSGGVHKGHGLGVEVVKVGIVGKMWKQRDWRLGWRKQSQPKSLWMSWSKR